MWPRVRPYERICERVCICERPGESIYAFLNCTLLTFLFQHFPFNVFTSYLIILPHRKRQTFICIFLVNIYIHLSVGLNGVHSAMNLELCSLTQSLAHAPIFLPFVSMAQYHFILYSYVCVCVPFAHSFSLSEYVFHPISTVCHRFSSNGNFSRHNFPLVEDTESGIKRRKHQVNENKNVKRRTEKIVTVFLDPRYSCNVFHTIIRHSLYTVSSRFLFFLLFLFLSPVSRHYHSMLNINGKKERRKKTNQNRSYIGRVIEFPTFRKMTLYFHTVIP